MALENLNEADRKHFRSRLEKFGVSEQQLRDEELVVRKDTRLQLSHRSAGTLEPVILKTKDLDQLKRWIGAPLEVTRLRRPSPEAVNLTAMPGARRLMQPSFGATVGRRATARASDVGGEPSVMVDELRGGRLDLRALRSPQLEEIRMAARAYVRGDHEMVAAYKPIIEEFYGMFEIAAWFFTTVIVEAGAVLEFGQGANVLSAYKVVIHDGGTVRSQGTLTVDCTVLQGRSQVMVGSGIGGSVITNPVIRRPG